MSVGQKIKPCPFSSVQLRRCVFVLTSILVDALGQTLSQILLCLSLFFGRSEEIIFTTK